MTSAPRETQAPTESLIAKLVPGSDFHDAWAVPAGDPGLTALGQFLKAASRTPRWVSACMSLRNRVVSLFGLKNLGSLEQLSPHKAEADYRPGDRDRHLDVTLSVHLTPDLATGASLVTLTTVVRTHNLLGRAYMLPVAPMHRLIAPAVLRAVAPR